MLTAAWNIVGALVLNIDGRIRQCVRLREKVIDEKGINVLTAVCFVSILSASLGRHAAVLTGVTWVRGAQADVKDVSAIHFPLFYFGLVLKYFYLAYSVVFT